MTKEVAKRSKGSELSETDMTNEEFYLSRGLGGHGLEDVTPDQLQIPIVKLLQDNSDQLKPASTEFIEGAKAGNLCIKDLGECFDKMLFVPCFYRKSWIEWKPRADGGGFIHSHDTDEVLRDCVQGPTGKPMNKAGNEIEETADWFGFRYVGHNAGFMECYVPMTSTKLKVSRRWLTISANQRMSPTVKAPLYSNVYELGSASETNRKGTFFNYTCRKVSWTRDFLAEQKVDPEWVELFIDSATKWRENARNVKREKESGPTEEREGDAF